MVVLSNDGSLEVSTSSKADASGRFTVSARQLTDDNIRGFINGFLVKEGALRSCVAEKPTAPKPCRGFPLTQTSNAI
jgi:hypothetical protein